MFWCSRFGSGQLPYRSYKGERKYLFLFAFLFPIWVQCIISVYRFVTFKWYVVITTIVFKWCTISHDHFKQFFCHPHWICCFFYSEHSNFECIFSCDDLFLNFLRRDTLHSYISAHILQFQFILIRIYFCYSNLCVYIETKTKNVRKLWNKQTNKTETKTKINQPHTYTNTIDVVNTYFVIVINYSHHMPLPEWQIYRKSRR